MRDSVFVALPPLFFLGVQTKAYVGRLHLLFGQRQKIAAQSRAFTPYLSDIECMTRTIFHRGSVAELESQVSLGKISKLPFLFLSRFCPVQQHSLLFTA